MEKATIHTPYLGVYHIHPYESYEFFAKVTNFFVKVTNFFIKVTRHTKMLRIIENVTNHIAEKLRKTKKCYDC